MSYTVVPYRESTKLNADALARHDAQLAQQAQILNGRGYSIQQTTPSSSTTSSSALSKIPSSSSLSTTSSVDNNETPIAKKSLTAVLLKGAAEGVKEAWGTFSFLGTTGGAVATGLGFGGVAGATAGTAGIAGLVVLGLVVIYIAYAAISGAADAYKREFNPTTDKPSHSTQTSNVTPKWVRDMETANRRQEAVNANYGDRSTQLTSEEQRKLADDARFNDPYGDWSQHTSTETSVKHDPYYTNSVSDENY